MQAGPVPVDQAAETAQERTEPFLVNGPAFLDSGTDGDERDRGTVCVPQVLYGGGGGNCGEQGGGAGG